MLCGYGFVVEVVIIGTFYANIVAIMNRWHYITSCKGCRNTFFEFYRFFTQFIKLEFCSCSQVPHGSRRVTNYQKPPDPNREANDRESFTCTFNNDHNILEFSIICSPRPRAALTLWYRELWYYGEMLSI